MDKNIFIGGAWPYANNSLHIGHLAALLPGDVLARYFRKNGNKVVYVSGSDCHGTPITLRAEKLGVTPDVIANHYHKEFDQNFKDLDFTYDLYTNTMTEYHQEYVKKQLLEIDKNGYLYSKTEDEDYCPNCNKFVTDREILGICPVCGAISNGDQCDKCLTALSPAELKDKKCKKCGTATILKPNKHLYFALKNLAKEVDEYFNEYKDTWRPTAINETQKYLREGLRDRAITRSLNWGIKLPFDGYDDKRMYVWFDAVLGYFSAGQKVFEQNGEDFNKFITSQNTLSYYVHGKDNIVFHTVILPGLLASINKEINKPQKIVSCEYVNMNGEKMSKSKGNLITVNTLLANFDSDSIRYYFMLNNPERKDCVFSLEDFVSIHNKHLVGGYGNFVNRNLAFLVKKFEGKLPQVCVDEEVKAEVEKTYKEVGELIEQGELKTAITRLYDYVQFANRYYDQSTPWTLAKEENLDRFWQVTSSCVYMIANMANLYEPFMPKRAKMVKDMLKLENSTKWEPISYNPSVTLENIGILFERIDINNVDLDKNADDTLKV